MGSLEVTEKLVFWLLELCPFETFFGITFLYLSKGNMKCNELNEKAPRMSKKRGGGASISSINKLYLIFLCCKKYLCWAKVRGLGLLWSNCFSLNSCLCLSQSFSYDNQFVHLKSTIFHPPILAGGFFIYPPDSKTTRNWRVGGCYFLPCSGPADPALEAVIISQKIQLDSRICKKLRLIIVELFIPNILSSVWIALCWKNKQANATAVYRTYRK